MVVHEPSTADGSFPVDDAVLLPVPEEVDNLFYVVRIKGLAARAGIETVTTEEGTITLRRFQALPFDSDKLASVRQDGVTIGRTIIKIDYQKLGRTWKRVLEEILGEVS